MVPNCSSNFHSYCAPYWQQNVSEHMNPDSSHRLQTTNPHQLCHSTISRSSGDEDSFNIQSSVWRWNHTDSQMWPRFLGCSLWLAPVLHSHPSLLFLFCLLLLLSDDSCSVLLSSDETAFSMQTSLTAKKEELQNPQSSGCSPHCWLSTEAPWNSGSCSPHREAMMCHDSRKTEKTERRPTASEEDR